MIVVPQVVPDCEPVRRVLAHPGLPAVLLGKLGDNGKARRFGEFRGANPGTRLSAAVKSPVLLID